MGLLVIAPFMGQQYILTQMTLILIYMAMGQMWNLMAGYAGLLSLGLQAFIGIGGYSLTILSINFGVNIFVAVFMGAILATLIGLIVSPTLFKMSGIYFAIGSWVIAEALIILFSNWSFVGYAKDWGINTVYRLTGTQLYYTALILGLGSVVIVFFLLKSRTGLALMAMRDSSSAAETLGVELYKTKLRCYLIACFVTGLAGGVMYMQQGFIKPSSGFSINWTIAMTFIVIIGGIGTMDGPIIGAIIYVLLTQFLYNLPGMSMIILGVIAIAVILIAPKGIMGTVYEKKGYEMLSPRRSLI